MFQPPMMNPIMAIMATTIMLIGVIECLALMQSSIEQPQQSPLSTNTLNMLFGGRSPSFQQPLKRRLLSSSPVSSLDFLVRNVRSKKEKSMIKPYLQFKNTMPNEVLVSENAKYMIECDVNGGPNPEIYWLKNGKPIQQDQVNEYAEILSDMLMVDSPAYQQGQLGLSEIKSRLYLECLGKADSGSVYTCVAKTPFDEIRQETKIFVKKLAFENSHNKELELFGSANQNSIDSSSSSSKTRDYFFYDSTAMAGCQTKKSISSPPRIHQWTAIVLENIGSNALLRCRASGSPRPAITWLFNEKPVLDTNKYIQFSNGDLLIKKVSFDEDFGPFKCLARNENGNDQTGNLFLYPVKPEK